MSEGTRLLKAGVSGGVFPGAAACIAYRKGGKNVFVHASAGNLGPDLPAVESSSPYDLASLTKPFVAMTALRMVADGRLRLESSAFSLMSDARCGLDPAVPLEGLLAHRGGVEAWGGLFLDVPHEPGSSAARRWIVSEAARRSLNPPTDEAVYSDLGYILVGALLSRVSGHGLDRLVREEVTDVLGISEQVYFAAALPSERRGRLEGRAAPTEYCDWRGRKIRGEVHDENCAALGGVSGHAGLFGNAEGVAAFGKACLDVLAGRSDFLPRALLKRALRPRAGGSHVVGWDTKSQQASSAGKRISDRAFGHLGFTGTSVWCDPERDVAVALLSNRVCPSRANEKIRGFRPAFHDGIFAAFDG